MIVLVGIILTLIALMYWFVFYPSQKIRQMKSNVVLRVNGADIRYPDLPLGDLGIFCKVNDKRRIQVIFPKLTPNSDVEYIYSWHDLNVIRIPTPAKMSTQDTTKLKAAQELASLIKEHLQLELEILSLRKQYRKIKRIVDLVSISDFYASQQEVYERALFQVEDLLTKAKELQQLYVRFIREALIGNQLAGYNLDLSLENQLTIDVQYRRIKEEYQYMKDTATAYANLLRTQQI